VSHYFESPPNGPDDPRLLTLQVQGRSLELRTGVGVFSRERIDHGTTVLLQTVPAPPAEGNFLDLGCGYGPIALTMASLSPNATVWAVDVNDRARELAAGNAANAGLTNVHFSAPEEVPPAIRFSVIWSNPPIRIGKAALHNLLHQWLSRLELSGEAFLVVQRHLGSDSLQCWLTEQGWPTSRVTSRRGFRVLRCQAKSSC
jgi:16S rRNA (guanine1207-N2)-methyltransferase